MSSASMNQGNRKHHPANRPAFERLEDRRLFAITFPSAPGLEFQTNGPERAPSIGDWYTTNGAGSTDKAHYLLIEVTPEMLAAGGGTVTITVNDAESADGAGPLDEVQGTQDPTRFQLLQSDRTTVIDSQTVASGSANGTAVTFSVTTVGTYYVKSQTGAFPISGDATADLNDDDNAYTITVSESGGLLGQYQATFQQTLVGNRNLFFVVGAGTTSLFLRNFDLDGATVVYTKPDLSTIAGTTSANGLWNGPSPTVDSGGDLVTGLTNADAGIWTATFSGVGIGNQTIFEPNTGDGQRIVLLDAAPLFAGNIDLGGSGTKTTRLNVPVDYTFTVRNRFAAPDVINLTNVDVPAGFSAVVLDADGNSLTDSTGDGQVDTGVIQPGQSKDFIVRVTPTSASAVSGVTTVSGVSLLDTRVDSANNVTRSVSFTTNVESPPEIADAVVDYGFLRSRNATLSGHIVAGDPGPHRVRVNWGDGTVSFIELADGQTEFTATHRVKGNNRRPKVRISVTDQDGLSSPQRIVQSRAQLTVSQVFQDQKGRAPTAAELRKYSKELERCRSQASFDELAADLASEI